MVCVLYCEKLSVNKWYVGRLIYHSSTCEKHEDKSKVNLRINLHWEFSSECEQ